MKVESLKQMKINETKTEQQRKALNQWARNNYIGSIIAGTGFGKSRCGVMAINYVLKHNPSLPALILVPTVQLQEQFRDEFRKWELEDCLDNITILCYQSAYKLQGQHYSIVVCDEIHLGLSPEYRKFFELNTYDRLLCMTATLPEEPEYELKLKELAPIVYRITLDQCVALGIVSPYKINCVPVELTTEERDLYTGINNRFVYYKMQLGYDAFNQAKFIMANKNSDPGDKSIAAQFYNSIRARKAIIDFASNKIKVFKELVSNNLDKKILAFGGANDFTDSMAASVNGVVYHSKKTKKQKAHALEAFKNDENNVLCSTKALNQGFDVPNANMGIVCGITSKGLSMIQRVGRLIRFQEGKVGHIYILYVKNSQEEKWLKNAVKSLNNVNWLP